MRSVTVFGRKVTNWELSSNSLKPHLSEMPHLQPLIEELDGIIVEAKAVDSEQERARGQLRELTRRRQDSERRGQDVRRRINAVLRGSFGFTSEQLIQFGIDPEPPRIPRARRTRRKPLEEKKPPAETPAAQS
ncbi:MAG TPA: hypothetical protein VE685_10040 [Thermoanaerobaculia bacterium]|nr:hypothetical protein [Thermoanaerobaculia bacterium]